MIVTRLIGGLGNQMFQYACGLYLARQSRQELRIDVSAFDTYNLHALAIDSLAITSERLIEQQRPLIPGRYRGQSRVRELATSLFGRTLKLRREKPFGFNARYNIPELDLYLDGYWQSEQFFPGMRDILRREFQPVNPLSKESKEVAHRIRCTQSVAVHVRRGDYVTDPETRRIYRSLDADYYRQCLLDLQQHIPQAHVFLFSNDVPWCLNHLDVGVPFTPVTHNDASTAWEDLHLMSLCRHAVIANSSFSWWGAFLGEHQADRRVYYPDPWFNPGTMDGTAIGCQDWRSERGVRSETTQKSAA